MIMPAATETDRDLVVLLVGTIDAFLEEPASFHDE